jgi:hypothetical protein
MHSSAVAELWGGYVQGNTPCLLIPQVFYWPPNTAIFLRPGTTGLGPTFGGRPTVLWNPQPQACWSGLLVCYNLFWILHHRIQQVGDRGGSLHEPNQSHLVTGRYKHPDWWVLLFHRSSVARHFQLFLPSPCPMTPFFGLNSPVNGKLRKRCLTPESSTPCRPCVLSHSYLANIWLASSRVSLEPMSNQRPGTRQV